MGEHPVKKLLLVASKQEDEVHMDKIPDLGADVVHHVVGHGHGYGYGYGCGCGCAKQSTERRAYLAGLGTDLNEKDLGINAQMEHHHSISRRLGLLEYNTRYMALQPTCRVQQEQAAVAADNEEEGEGMPSFVAILSRYPWDLHVLWQEYKFGVSGQKPAKDFTPLEGRKVK
eukprot:5269247-Ditylum_brightwellii.AAC.1